MREKHTYSGTAQEQSKPAIGSRRALLGSMATLGGRISRLYEGALHQTSKIIR